MNLSPRQPAGGQHTRLRPIDTVRPASSPGTSSVPRVVGEDGESMGEVLAAGITYLTALLWCRFLGQNSPSEAGQFPTGSGRGLAGVGLV